MNQTWKGINELPVIGNCKKKNKRNSTNSIHSNPNEVPTSDKYFATVGSKLASKDPPLNRTF